MEKDALEKIRERLNLLINEDSDYLEMLKGSQELDYFIAEFTSKSIKKYNSM